MYEENNILYGEGFLKDVRKLPREAQEKLGGLLELLRKDAFDPRLHAKALSAPLAGRFSFRITRDWRVGFRFIAPHAIQLLIADNRNRIYGRLERI
ncbi:MAG: hypothetical protein NUV53_01830 [Patescibacteria group bacterium]|nr:hypothetical protein [Patescibacteria group bacterium]